MPDEMTAYELRTIGSGVEEIVDKMREQFAIVAADFTLRYDGDHCNIDVHVVQERVDRLDPRVTITTSPKDPT